MSKHGVCILEHELTDFCAQSVSLSLQLAFSPVIADKEEIALLKAHKIIKQNAPGTSLYSVDQVCKFLSYHSLDQDAADLRDAFTTWRSSCDYRVTDGSDSAEEGAGESARAGATVGTIRKKMKLPIAPQARMPAKKPRTPKAKSSSAAAGKNKKPPAQQRRNTPSQTKETDEEDGADALTRSSAHQSTVGAAENDIHDADDDQDQYHADEDMADSEDVQSSYEARSASNKHRQQRHQPDDYHRDAYTLASVSFHPPTSAPTSVSALTSLTGHRRQRTAGTRLSRGQVEAWSSPDREEVSMGAGHQRQASPGYLPSSHTNPHLASIGYSGVPQHNPQPSSNIYSGVPSSMAQVPPQWKTGIGSFSHHQRTNSHAKWAAMRAQMQQQQQQQQATIAASTTPANGFAAAAAASHSAHPTLPVHHSPATLHRPLHLRDATLLPSGFEQEALQQREARLWAEGEYGVHAPQSVVQQNQQQQQQSSLPKNPAIAFMLSPGPSSSSSIHHHLSTGMQQPLRNLLSPTNSPYGPSLSPIPYSSGMLSPPPSHSSHVGQHPMDLRSPSPMAILQSHPMAGLYSSSSSQGGHHASSPPPFGGSGSHASMMYKRMRLLSPTSSQNAAIASSSASMSNPSHPNAHIPPISTTMHSDSDDAMQLSMSPPPPNVNVHASAPASAGPGQLLTMSTTTTTTTTYASRPDISTASTVSDLPAQEDVAASHLASHLASHTTVLPPIQTAAVIQPQPQAPKQDSSVVSDILVQLQHVQE